MPEMLTIPAAVEKARSLYATGNWDEAYRVLDDALDGATEREVAWIRVALVEGWNYEDWKRGLNPARDKLSLLAEVQKIAAEEGDDALLAAALFEQGMALHIAFVMAEPDEELELESFSCAAELFERVGDREHAAMATALIGIWHHVDKLDRETAEPIIRKAYEMAPPGNSLARAEAARHLGQIQQELGDPAGALDLLEESVHIREAAGWRMLLPSAYHALAYSRLEAGDLDGAERDLKQARSLAEEHGAIFTLAMIARTEADLQFARVAPNIWHRTHP